jgi:hypothetical protein
LADPAAPATGVADSAGLAVGVTVGAGISFASAAAGGESRSTTTRRFPLASMATSAKNPPLLAALINCWLVQVLPAGGQMVPPEVI